MNGRNTTTSQPTFGCTFEDDSPQEPQHVSVLLLDEITRMADASFDAATLRSLSIRFERLADAKDGGA